MEIRVLSCIARSRDHLKPKISKSGHEKRPKLENLKFRRCMPKMGIHRRNLRFSDLGFKARSSGAVRLGSGQKEGLKSVGPMVDLSRELVLTSGPFRYWTLEKRLKFHLTLTILNVLKKCLGDQAILKISPMLKRSPLRISSQTPPTPSDLDTIVIYSPSRSF
jgi:hypothetical protein